MKLARIHIRFGTTILPHRELGDDEQGHDQIDIEICDNEEVKELELVKAGPAYTRRMQTDAEALKSVELWEDGQGIGRSLVSDFESAPHPQGRKRFVNERVKGYEKWRYRLVTTEVADAPVAIDAGDEVVDAHVIEPPRPEEHVHGPGKPESSD